MQPNQCKSNQLLNKEIMYVMKVIISDSNFRYTDYCDSNLSYLKKVQIKWHYSNYPGKDFRLTTKPQQFQTLKTTKISISQIEILPPRNLQQKKKLENIISDKPSLTSIYLQNNMITKINIEKNTNLAKLSLSNNKLTTIDVTNNINLTHLLLHNNLLTTVDFTKNTQLTHLVISNNRLSEINVTQNKRFLQLNLQFNYLKKISLFLSAQKKIQDYNYKRFNFSHQLQTQCKIQIQCLWKIYLLICFSRGKAGKQFKQNHLKENWKQLYREKQNPEYNMYACKYTFISVQ